MSNNHKSSVILLSIVQTIQLTSCSNNKEQKLDVLPDAELCSPNTGTSDLIELCINFIDDDCDGETDENCQCNPHDTQRCIPNNERINNNICANENCSALKGICKYGKKICAQLSAGGSEWGAYEPGLDGISGTDDDEWIKDNCIGAILPQTEVCDSLDNDCDGLTDNLKLSCWSRDIERFVFKSPENPLTPCRMGIKECKDGRWSACEHEILPSAEECDGTDNNCNGLIDDAVQGSGTYCGITEIGQCEYGRLYCDSSMLDMMCRDYILPSEEVCDGIDNDCDGATDEDIYKPCETQCGSGFYTCSFGNWVNCSARQPEEEICDAFDNDCDGEIDEGLECACSPDLIGNYLICGRPPLTCGTGFFTCECIDEECSALTMTDCQAFCAYFPQDGIGCDTQLGSPSDEICNNWDDDCDGAVDEDLRRACYTGPRITRNVGVCSDGISSCSHGRWGNYNGENAFIDDLCINQILPQEEVCDGLDNDCDGAIDEDLNPHEKVDMVFGLDTSGSMCSFVQALRQGMQPYIADFINTQHRFAIINIPSMNTRNPEPEMLIDFTDAESFMRALAQWDCAPNIGIEPQYDAALYIAENRLNLSFRNDAFPLTIIVTDEQAQSNHGIRAQQIVQSLSPCQVGDCGDNDIFEIYSLVRRQYFTEWCAPANIAIECYEIYPGIPPGTINRYLNEIFADVCR